MTYPSTALHHSSTVSVDFANSKYLINSGKNSAFAYYLVGPATEHINAHLRGDILRNKCIPKELTEENFSFPVRLHNIMCLKTLHLKKTSDWDILSTFFTLAAKRKLSGSQFFSEI